MNILMNIIVLIFEVLYYSMFMYYAKKEGKFWRYILLFSLISVIGGFIGTNYLMSYIYLVAMILIGTKYYLKLKSSLYNLFIVVTMVISKIIIEFITYYILIVFLSNDLAILVFEIIKVILILIFKNKIEIFFTKFKKIWDNNNFYLRYIFSCLCFGYIIFSCLYLIYA